ncbi:zinc finger protein OZF-like [Sycon ciliatum]|uniref:zinc finger protein OZF-like n=1 Tax=Sycon ciliatum TaxID=27933 RepID=UPI0031F70398
MDDCDWTSEGSADSDALSPLPPLVIWTSRRSTGYPPQRNIPFYGTIYTAHHHANPNSGNPETTSEGSFANYALQHSLFTSWNTPTSTSRVLQDHPWLDTAADNFRPPRPEFQRNKDTRANDPSTATDDNPCSNPMTSAMDNGQRSQSNRNQTANHPVSVSDHYTDHAHVGYESEDGEYSGKSADLEVHNIEHVPVDLRMSSLSHKNQHVSESSSEADFQLQADFPQPETSLYKETGPLLERQHDMLDGRHSRPVEKPYECKFCDKSFSTQSSLTSHERTHREEKPFKCKVCDKVFDWRSLLLRHVRVHSGDKPFTCKFCAKSFSDKSNHTTHERYHTGAMRFNCDHCDQGFHSRSNLKIHLRIHTGERPYKCKECKKAFRQPSHLTDHQRVHTGEKPFKCNVCEEAFRSVSNLAGHQRIHTGEKPFKCKICEKSFSRKSNLKVHEGIHL